MSNENTQIAATQDRKSVLFDMANRFGMEPAAFEATLRATVMPANQQVSREQFAAFLLVAKEYNLNPLTKEIYAFPGKGGAIQPIVSIDGWMSMINAHPQFDGMEFEDKIEDGKLIAITCRMYRKDRKHPVEVTEYMIECRRDTDTWKRWPARMLRHKSAIQASRYAFGFSGIMDEDEAKRMIDVTPQQQPARTADESRPASRPSRLHNVIQNAGVTGGQTIEGVAEAVPVEQPEEQQQAAE